jgi:hypothetical protein
MAKRKRLIPSPLSADLTAGFPDETVSDMAETGLETKAWLRPGLGHAPAMPPIAQVAAEASARAALAEVAGAMESARAEGLLVQRLPLEAVEADHLMRDRMGTDAEEMGHLVASIRAHGQRTPIEVTELPGGRFGLISGWRRLQALRQLQAEGADFGSVLALLRRPAEASDAYVAMVEENEIRLGLSYYERARIVARSADAGVFASEKQALQRLFASGSRARRSKIGSFLVLVRHLDGALRFPTAIPERLGLRLATRIEAEPAAVAGLVADLAARPPADAAEEQARLAAWAAGAAGVPRGAGAAPAGPEGQELRAGVVLSVTGGWTRPTLILSGPGVDPRFRAALEDWLRTGR